MYSAVSCIAGIISLYLFFSVSIALALSFSVEVPLSMVFRNTEYLFKSSPSSAVPALSMDASSLLSLFAAEIAFEITPTNEITAPIPNIHHPTGLDKYKAFSVVLNLLNPTLAPITAA